ncbi:MAG: primosomal protein N' [Ignavibacteriaceae bacterium]|nr:primosomal protein N' [Ignavibacteriaceae bacterium]
MYVEVVFPLPFEKAFTYSVPDELVDKAEAGKRVSAPFGKRVITGFITNALPEPAFLSAEKIKPIRDIIDDIPLISSKEIEFYKWLADYYICSLGEAMRLASPPGTEVQSDKKISADPEFCKELLAKESKSHSARIAVLEVLASRENVTLNQLKKLTGKKSLNSVLESLEQQGAILVRDEVRGASVKDKKARFIKLAKPVQEIYDVLPQIESKSEAQLEVLLRLLKRPDREQQAADVIKDAGVNESVLQALVKKGLITTLTKKIERFHTDSYREEITVFELSQAQKLAIDEVRKSIDPFTFKPYLLHGITGSGKTQVYIELIKQTLELGKSAMILVPEISLTPQMTGRLMNNFGRDVTVFHSRVSAGERYDSWNRLLRGESRIAVGARSALFAPLQDLGLIVVDEEHDQSYKQDDLVPKYNARDCAVMKAKMHNIPVVLGSATPSVESMYNAKNGKYTLLSLPERIDNARLPLVTLVNIVSERDEKKMESSFSKKLLDKIAQRLTKKEGVIILQNRRGFATQLYCFDCGELEMCANCSVSMVYHINTDTLKCHYCGDTRKAPKQCSKCGSHSIKFFGTGTERVEDELQYHFPTAVISRIDSDSIQKKGMLPKTFAEFNAGEIDILVGTQLVSKGLDFPRVTLVGVIAAETSLWMPDFRSDERTFQLLTQVSGRAGRRQEPGEVVIQTQNDKSFVLQKVIHGDYYGFYEKEIYDRQTRNYPPFSRMCMIEIKHSNPQIAGKAINDLYKTLISFNAGVKISPPSSAVIFKLRGECRYQIMLRSNRNFDPSGSILRKLVRDSLSHAAKHNLVSNVRVLVDPDPQSIL